MQAQKLSVPYYRRVETKLVLGTAQFMQNYGAVDSSPDSGPQQPERILELAASYGLRRLDTAPAYGEAETIIGDFRGTRFEVTTKLSSLVKNVDDTESWVVQEIEKSKLRLGDHGIARVLLHDPLGFFRDTFPESQSILQRIRDLLPGVAIGASLYSPDDWANIQELAELDLIQIPMSPFDQRFLNSGVLKLANSKGVKVQARSIFLQGILIAPNHQLPTYFHRWKRLMRKWNEFCSTQLSTAAEICYNHAAASKFVDEVVVGVKSTTELHQIFNAATASPKAVNVESWASDDLELIDPRRWVI